MRIRLQPRRRPQGKRPPGKLNVALLSLPAHRLHFSNELAQRLDNLPIAAAADDAAAAAAAAENASVENRWCQLRDTVQSTALAVLGSAPRQHQGWFDDNDAAIRNLLAEKNRLHKAYVEHPTEGNKAAFYRSRRRLQQRLREMQDAWTARKAEEIQGYADRNEWKNFFSAIKAVYGPPTKGTAPLLSADGSTLLTEKTQILQRWAEHFRGVLNRPSVISEAAIARLPQVATNADLDLPPSLQETIRAVQQLSSGKAPGSDAIPAEVYKHRGPLLMDQLTALFQEMWRQGEVPQDFKDANIVHLYKRKGNRQVCDNHRGISLLNIAGKIFARILLNHLNNHLEQGLLPESQCGFRRHRGTTDMIFAARQLQEKCQEMRTHLYPTFVDLTIAFDTVNREGLWKIMQKFGCPERFTQMVRQLHDGMMARVTDNGAVSEAFAVTNGVKQGCVLAPTLFSLMFSAMLMDAYRDERPGIRIAYRTDGHLLNRRRMNFQSRVSTATVHELLFADDCALNTTSEVEMQRSMDLFSAACENIVLVINTQKTVVMHQPPPSSATAPNAPQINVNGTQLQVVENFPAVSGVCGWEWAQLSFAMYPIQPFFGLSTTTISTSITRPIPGFSSAFLFGACAGFTAGLITHPFDVVKTHRQIELGESIFGNRAYSKSTLLALRQLYRQKGLQALYSAETINYLCDVIRDTNYPLGMSLETLKELLTKCSQNVQFLCNGQLYRQIDGVAMGSPLGPFLANVCMGKVEMTSLQDTINNLSFYGRTNPAYYESINSPMDPARICGKIKSEEYQSIGEMADDIKLMVSNARSFFGVSSQEATDATEFEAAFDQESKQVLQLQSFTSAASTSSASSTVTDHSRRRTSLAKEKRDDEERGRGRPRKRPLETSYSSPESSRQSTPSRQTPLGGGRVSSFSREASLLGGESGTELGTADDTQTTTAGYSLPSASPATVALSTSFGSSDGNTSGLGMGFMDEVIPSMLSTAAVGSLRWWGEHVLEAICTATNSTGRLLAMPFMRLPSKKLYPDYYRKIAHPICLAKIRRRIKRNEYDGLADVRHDLDLAFNNAQLYNMEGSAVYNDAVFLQQLTKNKFVELSQIAAKTENAVRAVRVSAPRRRLGVPMSGSTSASPSMDAGGSDTRRPIGRHPMTAEEAKTKRLSNLFHAVYNYVDEHGHYPRDTFMVLPSKEEYPDYYTVITEPIDLTMIKERMDNNLYSTHQAMVADLRLMFNNAKHYNEENSQVYRDAVSLDRVVKKKLKSLGPYSSLGSLSPAGSALKVRKMSPLEKQQEFVNYGTTYGVTLGPSLTPGSPGGLQSGQTGQSNVPPLQRLMMENVDERDVFVCESQFSLSGQIFVKIRRWGAPTPYGVELEDRPVPFVPTRLPPSEPLESALEQVNTNAFTCMTFPLPRPVQSVVDDMSKADEVISYEQYAHENGFIIKQGDCLFVAPPSGSGEKQIVRIDKITKNTSDDTVYFTGVVMVSPAEVDHLPTRLFYPREVFMTNNEKATFPLSAALGKCFVMRPADFCIARPTGYRESEVYICESRYHEDEKQLRKLKKPFKKYNFTPETLEDEFFFFPQPIVPLKEASPMLGKVSPTPLSMEQLDRPASSALASVVASANLPSSGVPATIPTSFESSIQAKPDPTTPNVVAQRPAPQQQVLDLGQLAFMEAGLDRSGKKRKLRKPPSGYVIYAGEVRKKLLHERPDAPFGEISREVGLLWRQMPANERDVYERKAQLIKRRMEEEESQVKARLALEQQQQQQQQQNLLQQQQQQQQQNAHVGTPVFGGPGLHAGNLHHESLTRGVSGSVENNLITMVPAGPVAAAQGVSLHPGPTAASQQHQPSAMHFYQTPTGQVIQLMHTTAGAGVAATGVITTAGGGSATTLRAPPQPVTSLGGPVAVQSNMDHGTPLMAGATTVIANPVPQVVGNVGSGHAPLIAASASQQVVYQFTGQQATPCGSGLPPPNVNIGGPVSGHQVILTHPLNQQGPPIGGNVLATQPQSFATAPGHLMHATRQAVPMPLPQHQANSQQPCVQVLQQINPGPDNHAMSATQATTGSPAMTSLPSAVGLQPCTVTPGTTASTAAGISTFVNQPQAPPRPPSPLFVSLPPRTSRVLHSEIYQRYIDRLRRNAPGLSDWRKQLAATVDSVPPLTPQQQQQMANNFLDTPHIHAHQGSIVEALWSLRDNLLKDSLNIRVRCLGVEEL
nr:unnamed protein product [Spirometra erinaceieuropaei]